MSRAPSHADATVAMESVPAAKLLACRLHVDARETVRLQAVRTAEGCVLSDAEGSVLRPVAAARIPVRPDTCMVLFDAMRPGDDDGPGDARTAQPYLGLVHWMFGGIRLGNSEPWLVACPSARILGETTPMTLFERTQASLPCDPSEFLNPLVRAEGIADKPQAALVLERHAGEIDPSAEGDNDDEDDEEDDEAEGDEDEDEDEDDDETGVAALMEDEEDEEEEDELDDDEEEDDEEEEEEEFEEDEDDD